MMETDADLVRRFREGDGAAFDEIHRRYAKRVYAFHFNQCHDKGKADELTQETFVKLYLTWSGHKKNYDSIGAVLTTTAQNIVKDRSRREKREERNRDRYEAFVGIGRTAPAADAQHNRRELMDVVANAAATLPPTMNEVLLLFLLGDYTAKEVAAITRMKVATVYKYIQRGSARLAGPLRPFVKGAPYETE